MAGLENNGMKTYGKGGRVFGSKAIFSGGIESAPSEAGYGILLQKNILH